MLTVSPASTIAGNTDLLKKILNNMGLSPLGTRSLSGKTFNFPDSPEGHNYCLFVPTNDDSLRHLTQNVAAGPAVFVGG